MLAIVLVMGTLVLMPTTAVRADDETSGESVTAELTATKVLEGGDLEADQFEFTIEAKTEGAPMPANTTAKNDADGKISFGTATYTAAGTYEYTVKEVKGNDSNITYDTSEQTITVVVKENDTTSSTAPDNGWDYTPTKHTWSTSGSDDGSTARSINFGTYSQGDTLANYTTKKTVNIEGVNEYVFCGANYKSASESSYNKVALFWAEGDASYKPWGVNWDGKLMSSTDGGNKQNDYPKWLDRVAFLYSKDYANIDSSNASGAWNTTTYPYVLTQWSLRDAVQKVLWNAFPYNAAGFKSTGDDLYVTTQMALFFVLRNGGAYQSEDYAFTLEDDDTFRGIAPNKDDFDALVKYALSGTQTDGYSFQNYPESIETYVYWNTNNDGDVGSLTAQPLIGVYADYTPPAMTADVTPAEFKNTVVSSDNPDETNGKLNTTVKAAGKEGSASAAAELTAAEAGTVTEVTDKIDYSGLIEGATYTVSGTLVEVENGKVVKDVATAGEDKVAETADGTWEITFKNVKLKAGKTYVVFEEAKPIKDKDGNEVTDGDVVEHKDANDKSQTVVVQSSEESENPTTPEKPVLVKEVDGGKNVKLDDWSQSFTYVIRTTLPKGAQTFKIIDPLEPVLSYVDKSATVKVAGKEVTDVETSYKDNTLTWDLGAYLDSDPGASVEIRFDAKVKKDADLSDYEDGIPNVAGYDMGDGFEVAGVSNEVRVLPPDDDDEEAENQGSTANNSPTTSKVSRLARNVRTGDNTPIGLLVIVLAVAAGCIGYGVRRKQN